MRMYVASAGEADSTGVYRVTLDTENGVMHAEPAAHAITNCLYLALHPTQPVLYAVGQAQIAAFRMLPDGGLSLINQQATGGDEPCYVSVTADGQHALVANYTGSLAVLPLRDDGGIDAMVQHILLPGEGAGVHAFRQDAPHPHMIVPLPNTDWVFVPDLGTDHVWVYRRDPQSGQLASHDPPFFSLQAGSGPRHLTFHPTQPIIYVLSELTPLLTVITYDAAGHFQTVGTYPTLPPGEPIPDNNLGADIHITPSGRLIYASNRGHDSLAIFTVDASGQGVTSVGHQSTLGEWPRGFRLDPAGERLIVANQHTDDLQVFRIDPSTGQLTLTGAQISVSAPVCVIVG